jgi:hypothetical protein
VAVSITAYRAPHASRNGAGPNGAFTIRGQPVTRMNASDANTAICSVRALPVTYGPNADRHTIRAHHRVFLLAVMGANANGHRMLTSGDQRNPN